MGRGIARGQIHAPNGRLSDFFLREKNWLCWNVGPALFIKVTLFSLLEVFCGPQICQKRTPLLGELKF